MFQKANVKLSPSVNTSLVDSIKTNIRNPENSLPCECFPKYFKTYSEIKNRCLAGEFGSTAQYWMVYQKINDLIHQLHYAINVNDYFLRLASWEELLTLSFVMNKQNYSRYGTYYVLQLRSIDSTHPGARQEIEEKGVSVCRNEFGIRQSIDGAGGARKLQVYQKFCNSKLDL